MPKKQILVTFWGNFSSFNVLLTHKVPLSNKSLTIDVPKIKINTAMGIEIKNRTLKKNDILNNN